MGFWETKRDILLTIYGDRYRAIHSRNCAWKQNTSTLETEACMELVYRSFSSRHGGGTELRSLGKR